MSLDPNKTYLVWNGTEFPNSTSATFKAPAGSTIDWGDGTVETFDTASTTVNTHTYTDGKTEHTIAISGLTSIGTSAFRGCSSLTSVTIPDSVTSIGNSTFRDCSSLTNITIPNSIPSIGIAAFNNCSSLTNITIPDSVTSIGEYAFSGCSSLRQLILFPSTPPTLGSNAIPNNVQSIYVRQSSKATYQSATNWNTFASKIVSDNIYLSFVRFNKKNKEYIDGKVNELNEKIGNSSGGEKLYKHTVTFSGVSGYFEILSTIQTALTLVTMEGAGQTQVPSGFLSSIRSFTYNNDTDTSTCLMMVGMTFASNCIKIICWPESMGNSEIMLQTINLPQLVSDTVTAYSA